VASATVASAKTQTGSFIVAAPQHDDPHCGGDGGGRSSG
jgi:hypothetical protein